MFVQLTDHGSALIAAQQGPIQLQTSKLGSDFNFTPEATDTDIHGTLLWTGDVTPYGVISPNVVKYTVILDTTVGTFNWGNVGLYSTDGQLFALCVSPNPITKTASQGSVTGNSTRIDIFLSMNGENYDMWFDVSESNNPFKIASLYGVDYLPASSNAVPNMYAIRGYEEDTLAFLAYTDRTGWWTFDAYQYMGGSLTETPILAVTGTSIDIPIAAYEAYWKDPTHPSDIIFEVISGPAYSYCRQVISVVVNASSVTLGFRNPWGAPPWSGSSWTGSPNVGDYVVFFVRNNGSELTLPIATYATTGVVYIDPTSPLTVAADGKLSLDQSKLDLGVTSFNTQTGVTTFEIIDNNPATGTSLIADNGYNKPAAKLKTLVPGSNITIAADSNGNLVISGTTAPYTLPIASATVLGGVKVGTGLSIDTNGVLSSTITQTTVNGQSGNVSIYAEDTPGATGVTLISDSGASSGVIKLQRIKAGTGTTVTSVGGDLVISASGYVLPIAGLGPTGPLGGVMVDGSTITIDANGTISSHVLASELPAATTTTPGVVTVGSTLTVVNGVLNYTLPIAGTGAAAVLGGVKVDGTTVTINASTGVISAVGASQATTTSPGIVQIGSGLNITNGVLSLPIATATVLGGVKIGAGLAVTGDGTISVTATGAITSVNTMTGAVTISASDTSTASGTTLITDSGATDGTIKIRRLVAGTNVTLATDGNNNLIINSVWPSSFVTSVSTQTGAVVVSAVDNSTASGVTLIADSGATTGTIKLKRIVAGQGMATSLDANQNLVIALNSAGTLTGLTSPNLMINESGDLGTTGAGSTYLWTDSNSGVIAVQTNLWGRFWRIAARSTAGTGTILSPAFPVGGSSTALGQMQMRLDATATGTVNFNVLYYNSSNALVFTGATSGASVAANGNWSHLFTAADSYPNTAVTARVQINYTSATWATLDWCRGKVEASTTWTPYSMEGTTDVIVSTATAAVRTVSSQSPDGNGNVAISVSDNNAATGTTLVANTGATTGAAKLRTLVAGTGVTITSDTNSNLVIAAAVSTANNYDIPFGVPTTLSAGQLVGAAWIARNWTIPASFSGSSGYCQTAPASISMTFNINMRDPSGNLSTIGTVLWSVNAFQPVFTMSGTGSSPLTVQAGSFITIVAPASVDGTFQGFACTILGTA